MIILSIILYALCVCAKRADKDAEKMFRKYSDDKDREDNDPQAHDDI